MNNPNIQAEPYPQPPQPPQQKKSSKKILIIILAVLAVLLLCCCIVAVVFIVADPFNLDLIGRLAGKADAAAQAVPEDIPLYMSINLLSFNSDKVDRIIKPFMESSGEFDENNTQDLIDQLDEQLNDEIGLTLTDDVIPWIGQYIGIGITDPGYTASYGSSDPSEYILIIEARDKGKADEFIQKIIKKVEERGNTTSSDSEYKDITIYTLEKEDTTFSICRSGSLVLIGNPETSIQNAIDAQKGDNLRKNADYKKIMAELPKERNITIYINADKLKNIAESMSSDLGSTNPQYLFQSVTDAWKNSAVSLSLIDAGIRLDVASAFDQEQLSNADQNLLSTQGGIPDSVNKLPSDTIMYIASHQLNKVWEIYRDSLIESTGSRSDYDEMMNNLTQQIGFNLEDDLLTYLDKDWSIALLSESNGLVQQLSGYPIGIIGLFGTSNEDAVKQTASDFADYLGGMGVISNDISGDNYNLFALSDPYAGTSYFAYGFKNNYLTIGTSKDTLINVFEDSSLLGNDLGHNEVWNEFSKNITPVFYVNVSAGVDLLKETVFEYDQQSLQEIEKYISPITYIAMGSTPLSNDVTTSTLIIFVDQD